MMQHRLLITLFSTHQLRFVELNLRQGLGNYKRQTSLSSLVNARQDEENIRMFWSRQSGSVGYMWSVWRDMRHMGINDVNV